MQSLHITGDSASRGSATLWIESITGTVDLPTAWSDGWIGNALGQMIVTHYHSTSGAEF